MSVETQPIWKDPVAHLILAAGATVATGSLLMQYVTVPYFFAIAERWHRVSVPIATAVFGSPEALIDVITTLPTSTPAIIPFVGGWFLVAVITAIPLALIAGLPFYLSYLFWMKLVYGRVLSAGDTA